MTAPFAVVLGIAQDSGYPQAGCRKACCAAVWESTRGPEQVACLGIVDPEDGQRWLIDCTPDFRPQLAAFDRVAARAARAPTSGLSGILLTHAHTGHYAGLIHLGREAMSADRIAVYAMPKMRCFLENNAPWEQLVRLNQIVIHALAADQLLRLNARVGVTPFLVPHRNEYSETVGFRICGPTRSVMYLPDIDNWEDGPGKIENLIAGCDVAYLDGTFFSTGELAGRDMAEVPHPLVAESIDRFRDLPAAERGKVRFTHLNHTNPLFDLESAARQAVVEAGHHVARQGEQQTL